jgi:hypothetical protein
MAYHVESVTLDDGIYELIQEPKQGFSKDQVNVSKDLTEVPNQGSEVFDIPDPSPAQEGKPQCITQYFKLLHLYSFMLIYLYYALSLEVEMEP